MYYSTSIKRLVDFIVSFTIIVIAAPLLILVALIIKLTSRGPIFFKQERVGLHKHTFFVLKFRTMIARKHDTAIQTLPGDKNVTFVGNFLRRFKIDELPQLFNILKGDMSIVGPRPCLPSLLKDLNSDGEKRFSCRPGMTGLAQINGNIYLSWEERWRYDAEYARDIKFSKDCRILIKTIFVVLFGEEKFKRKM